MFSLHPLLLKSQNLTYKNLTKNNIKNVMQSTKIEFHTKEKTIRSGENTDWMKALNCGLNDSKGFLDF